MIELNIYSSVMNVDKCKKIPFVIWQHHEKEIFLSFLHVVKLIQGDQASHTLQAMQNVRYTSHVFKI